MTAYRIAAPLAALLVFVLLSGLYAFGERGLVLQVLKAWGAHPFTFPFVDISGSLAAWECTRLGVDVVVSDPCDVLGRPYAYSPFWMALAAIPLGVTWTAPVGFLCGLVFLASLAFLPAPRSRRAVAISLVAVLSPTVAYAVERANPDIIIFVMTLAVGYFALGRPWARGAAYGIAILAGAIKYYPLTLLVIAARERARGVLAIGALAACAIGAFVAVYLPDMIRGIPLIASGSYYSWFFAAKNLPFGIAPAVRFFGGASLAAPIGYALYGLLVVGVGIVCSRIAGRGELRAALSGLASSEAVFLVLGSALIVGCFFAGQSIYYRAIFLLFVLPGLLAIPRPAMDGALGLVIRSAAASIVFLLWEEAVRNALNAMLLASQGHSPIAVGGLIAVWLLREAAWWWVVAVMAVILVDFVLASDIGRVLRAAAGRIRRARSIQVDGPPG